VAHQGVNWGSASQIGPAALPLSLRATYSQQSEALSQ